jgi:HAD superfamily hydrolase (TIGR01459 family)
MIPPLRDPLWDPYVARMSEVEILSGLSQWAGQYDALVCDLWGVVHNGRVATPSACDALIRFRQAGGKVALLSNAPRPSSAVEVQLDGFGVPREAWDSVVTSGDVTREAINRRPDAWHQALGRRCFHLGPARDKPLFEGLDVDPAGEVEAADFILCTGLLNDETETAETYRPLFERTIPRGQRFLCANPDRAVMRGPQRVPCAGALSQLYANMGGEVREYGKPHANAYALCFERLHGVEPKRVLAIGDGLLTDIAGANAIGLDALFIWEGVHGAEIGSTPNGADLGRICRDHQLTPKAAMRELAW